MAPSTAVMAPKGHPVISTGAGIAGWALASVMLLLNGVLASVVAVYCCRKRVKVARDKMDLQLQDVHCDSNQAYHTVTVRDPHYQNVPSLTAPEYSNPLALQYMDKDIRVHAVD